MESMHGNHKVLVAKLIVMDILAFLGFSFAIVIISSLITMLYSIYEYFNHGLWDFYKSWGDLNLSVFIILPFSWIFFNFIKSTIFNIKYYFKLRR